MRTPRFLQIVLIALWCADSRATAASTKAHYYGHDAVVDAHGVIAPWYKGLNGQCDLRVRIAAETLKRYPWMPTNTAIAAYPDYVFSGHWQITSNGMILPQTPSDWDNGVINIRFTSLRVVEDDHSARGEAFVQAIEVGPGSGGRGATPVPSAAESRGSPSTSFRRAEDCPPYHFPQRLRHYERGRNGFALAGNSA